MVAAAHDRPDRLEVLSRFAVLTGFVIALMTYLAAPLLALSWRHEPFPGFLVQPRLVVSVTNGEGWTGREAGLNSPQLVLRVDGQSVGTTQDYQRAISALHIGDEASFFTVMPDGAERLYPSIRILAFSSGDMMRLFGLPYLIGFCYLVIGGWIYRIRGSTRPGRALAYTCVIAAIALGALFDVYSTHAISPLYTVSIAMVGATLISMAWRFPDEWRPVRHHAWMLAVPYSVSAAVAIWGVYAMMSRSNPWAFMAAWFASYAYAALGILILAAGMLDLSWRGKTVLVRRQARVILAGVIIAFTPIAVWFIMPLFGIVTFHPLFVFPWLLVFPISVAIAILHFHLWEVDTIVSRAFVYGLVTAILAGVFAALSTLTQKTFIMVTGEKSDAAIVLSTLVIAAAFTPVRSLVQRVVDRELKNDSGVDAALRSFRDEVQAHTEMSDVLLLTKRLLSEAATTLHAESGAVSLVQEGRLQTVHTFGRWKGDCRMSIPIMHHGRRYGLLLMGPPEDPDLYTEESSRELKSVVEQVAAAIHISYSQMEGPSTATVQPFGMANVTPLRAAARPESGSASSLLPGEGSGAQAA